MPVEREALDKKFRVSEIFGPTIQGEGRHAGTPCYFIRFGGCDFRCRWCDTPFAVLPEEVSKLPQLHSTDILHKIYQLPGSPDWIVLSGGNPGLLDLRHLIDRLHNRGYKVMMETQGSTWRDWYVDLEELCFSPKPPSSGMDDQTFPRVIEKWEYWNPHTWQKAYLKIVVFDEYDYEWAKEMRDQFSRYDFFLSVGNEDPWLPTVSNPNVNPSLADPGATQRVVLEKTRWLFEKVASDPDMSDVRVMPQLHTLAWGNARGR